MKLILLGKKRKIDTFNRANGALGGAWQFTNSAWTIVSSQAVCTPTLGAELVVNGSFAADASWSKGTGWTISAGVASHVSGSASNLAQTILTAGLWYKATWTLVSTDGDQAYAIFGSNVNPRYATIAGEQVDTNREVTITTAGIRAQSATLDASVDNVSYKAITLSDMFASIVRQKNANIQVNVTLPSSITNSAQAGAGGWLNSYISPTDFIVAYISASTTSYVLKVEKCVGGVYTTLISAAITYVAGASVKLKGARSGENLLLDAYYNGVQVGTQQTVSDAGIIDNTRHGMFSTSEFATLDNFSIA